MVRVASLPFLMRTRVLERKQYPAIVSRRLHLSLAVVSTDCNNRSLISDLVAALPHFRTRCYTAQENTRRSMLVPFVSNQRP